MHLIGLCVSAFVVGLLGSVHCVGMCGGIAGALAVGIPTNHSSRGTQFGLMICLSVGRLLSYGIAGLIAGGIGFSVVAWLGPRSHLVFSVLSGAMMICLGFYIAGLWFGLQVIERGGLVLWRRVSVFTRAFMPIDHIGKALMLGLLWGAIPCGLVYSALVWALGVGNAWHSALLMMAFGLGTLPMMVTVSHCAASGNHFLAQPWIRRVAGGLIVAYGLWTMCAPWLKIGAHCAMSGAASH